MDDKPTYVRSMFGRIAGCYDRANTLMTAGQDHRWRQLAAEATAISPGGTALDVATGTGESALVLAERGVEVVGLDFCQEMLAVAQAKLARRHVGLRLAVADALALPFLDDTFDGATTAFSLRNVASVPRTLAEMRRVVRPGGRVVCLELTPLTGRLWPRLYRLYAHRVAPFLARIAGGEGEAYHYLPSSVERFLTADELKRLMEDVGLQQVSYRRLNLGTVALHVGMK